mgnify:CR=1 FL=1
MIDVVEIGYTTVLSGQLSNPDVAQTNGAPSVWFLIMGIYFIINRVVPFPSRLDPNRLDSGSGRDNMVSEHRFEIL